MRSRSARSRFGSALHADDRDTLSCAVFVDDEFSPDLYLIRLQGPWSLLRSPGAPLVRLHLPLDDDTAASIAAEATGSPVKLLRNFQRPTNLDPEERVLLLLPAGAKPTEVRLGRSAVGAPRELGPCWTWDLTPALQPGNQLQLVFEDDAWMNALAEPVLLGIMPDADGSWWRRLPAAR